MKQNPLLITGSVLVAAWMTTGTAMAQSGTTDTGRSSSGSAQSSKEIHPSPKAQWAHPSQNEPMKPAHRCRKEALSRVRSIRGIAVQTQLEANVRAAVPAQ